ncbi:MAG: thioesterase family protein [Pseudomonadota bacterium]
MTRLKLHSEPVQDGWLDAYGHLNEAYYLVPFSNATWILQDHFDIGVPYFEATGCAIYTVETHLRYLAEVKAPAVMEIESFIIGSDAKRIWFAHEMIVDGTLRATGEFMVLHYDTRQGRTAAMPDEVQNALQEAAVPSPPDWAASQIGLKRR